MDKNGDEYEKLIQSINNRIDRINKNNRRDRRVKQQSFYNVFEEVKSRFQKNNISIQEICDNARVSREFVELLWTENIISDISRIIELSRVRITLTTSWDMNVYRVRKNKNTIKVSRTISPKCHIYYDINTGNFYNFHIEKDSKEVVDVQVLIKEMAKKALEHTNKE